MKRVRDDPTPRVLPPAFNQAVDKVLAYQPKNERTRSHDHPQGCPILVSPSHGQCDS